MDDIEKNAGLSATPETVSPAASPPRSLAESEVDEALAFLRHRVASGAAVEIDENRLRRKIDWMIVPCVHPCPLLSYQNSLIDLPV